MLLVLLSILSHNYIIQHELCFTPFGPATSLTYEAKQNISQKEQPVRLKSDK